MEIHEHRLLELRLAVLDCNRIVVSVEPVNERLYRGLVDVPNVGRCLSRLLTLEYGGRVDEAESINDDLPLYRLNGVNNNCYGTMI